MYDALQLGRKMSFVLRIYLKLYVCLCLFICGCVCVCSHIAQERNNQFTLNLAFLLLLTRGDFIRVKTPESCHVFEFRRGLRAERLRTIEEPRPDQSCLLRRGDYRNKYHNPEKSSWTCVPVKIFSVTRRPIKIQE
jgi:hypothetical protein